MGGGEEQGIMIPCDGVAGGDVLVLFPPPGNNIGATPEDRRYNYEERCAIREHEGKMFREEAEILTRAEFGWGDDGQPG